MYVLLNELPSTGIQLPHPKVKLFFQGPAAGLANQFTVMNERLLFAVFQANGNGLQVICKVTTAQAAWMASNLLLMMKPQPDVSDRDMGN